MANRQNPCPHGGAAQEGVMRNDGGEGKAAELVVATTGGARRRWSSSAPTIPLHHDWSTEIERGRLGPWEAAPVTRGGERLSERGGEPATGRRRRAGDRQAVAAEKWGSSGTKWIRVRGFGGRYIFGCVLNGPEAG
jgi:hypothetical protein